MPRHCRNIARTLLRLKSRMYELEAEDVDEDEDEDGHDSLSTRLRPRSMRKLLKLRARIWELEAAMTAQALQAHLSAMSPAVRPR